MKNEKKIIVENLDLVLDNLQNCKFLKTWTKMLCFIYHKKMVVDRRHAYESHEKKMSKKKLKWMINETLAIQGKSKKKIDFHFFGGK